MSSFFSRECNVNVILRDRVFSGRFAGGDYRVSFGGQPARRGQPFVAVSVTVFPVHDRENCSSHLCFQDEALSWWTSFFVAAFELPLGTLPLGSLRACLLPSPAPYAEAVLLLTTTEQTSARGRQRPSRGSDNAFHIEAPIDFSDNGSIESASSGDSPHAGSTTTAQMEQYFALSDGDYPDSSEAECLLIMALGTFYGVDEEEEVHGEMRFRVQSPLATHSAWIGLSPISTRIPLPIPTESGTSEMWDYAAANPFTVPFWTLLN